MIVIFDAFIDGSIDGESSLNKEYAKLKGISFNWISSEDMCVQDVVDDICDAYEQEGIDLDLLPVSKIGERFHLYEPTYSIPKEYQELVSTKEYFESELKHAISNNHSSTIVSFIKEALEKVETNIKGLQ